MPLKKPTLVTESVPLENSGTVATITHITPAPAGERDVLKAEHTKTEPKPNAEWEAQERKRQRGQRWDSAIMSPALMQYAPTLDAYIELVVRTANAGLAYVNE